MGSYEVVPVPGCRRERQRRLWSVHHLAKTAGVHPTTAAKADRGEGVRSDVARAIVSAFEKYPPSKMARAAS